MAKAVLMSVQHEHILNMHSGKKTSELRAKSPKIPTPFKVYNLDTKSSGGCGKVVSEWVCNDITEWFMYMGMPVHLPKVACVSQYYIQKYSDNGNKNISEMKISNLVIYDEPKELSEFIRVCPEWEKEKITNKCIKCEHYFESYAECLEGCDCEGELPITRPPQSWCYVEELE